MNEVDRAVAGGELAGLTKRQKRELVRLARVAYGRAGAGMAFEEWRHEQQREACGLASLRAATQKDYRALRGHFRALAGDKVGAFRDIVAAETGDAGYAHEKLRHECEAAGDVIARPVEYVQAISRSRYKTSDLRSLSARELWGLVFDIRRAAQRRRKEGHRGLRR